MYIDFNKLSDNARIWIYQADRPFSKLESSEISQRVEKFIDQWDSHGATVEGSYLLEHSRFIILASHEENAPSGCSIDKSVHLIRALEDDLEINFFVRSNVVFRDNKEIRMITVHQIADQIKAGILKPETLVFDNTIQRKKDLQHWQKPAVQTWLKQYFNV